MATRNGKPAITYETYVGAPASKVWRGLVDGELTKQYVYGTRFNGELKPGAPYAYLGEGDWKVVEGKLLDVKAHERLAMTWRAQWDEAVKDDRPSRVTYELVPTGPDVTRLRVVHDDFDAETATYRGSVDAWPMMLSSLKTLLECGRALAFPQGG
jgi:uncharacterized protein YndB with AHSA1/START domain